jgi:hypothetical protein
MSQSSKPPPESTGSRFSITFAAPTHWTPEEALAVFELLDDLRELIWAHAGVRLVELVQAERSGPQTEVDSRASSDDVDF